MLGSALFLGFGGKTGSSRELVEQSASDCKEFSGWEGVDPAIGSLECLQIAYYLETISFSVKFARKLAVSRVCVRVAVGSYPASRHTPKLDAQ
jgi:hypothetical protein